MRIVAAVSREVGDRLSIEEVELDEPRADEVRVRVIATGICHTDHSVMRQHFVPSIALPMVLGHEGAGIVETVGSAVTSLKPGDPVVLTIDSCGECSRCRGGRPGYCDHALQMNFGRARRDGRSPLTGANGPIGGAFFGQSSFASRAIARVNNTVKIPRELPLERMGPLGCGLQTGAGALFNVIKPSPGSGIAVFGVGAVGLAAVMAAKVAGCDPIIAVDLKTARLEMARELGATHLITGDGNLLRQLTTIAPRGLDAAIDTTAIPQVFAAAVEALRTAGSIVLLGAPPGDVAVTLPMNSILIGRTIRGSLQGDAVPQDFIPRLADLHRRGLFPFEKFITYYPFEEINRAIIETAVTGTAIKAVVLMPRSQSREESVS